MTTETTKIGSPKYRKTLKLFKEQKELCWICGMRMLSPVIQGNPNRLSATLDHIRDLKTGKTSDKKAAHACCNNARHHYTVEHPKMVGQIKCMKKLFSNSNWRAIVFQEAVLNAE